MTLITSKGILLIGVYFLVCSVSGRILDGRAKRALPPSWTQIPNNDKCLVSFKASASHSEKCIPLKPLTACPIQTWDQLREALTEEDAGKKKKSREVPLIKPPGKIGLGAPAYLSVPNFKQCLGTLQRHGESHTSYCLPDSKPEGCQNESWERLLDKAVFQGGRCTENLQTKRQVVGLGAPAYLSVSGHQGCLGSHQKPGESHTSLCLPAVKPEECPLDSWDKLQDKTVFDGDDCEEIGPANKLGAPAYLSVPGYQQCLGEHKTGNDSHTSLCLPEFKPVECPVGSWQQLQNRKVFNGDECSTSDESEEPEQVNVGPPAYLSVTGFQQCLLERQKPDEAHTSFCLPETKPENCLQDAWQKLKDENVFKGDDCMEKPDDKPVQSGPPGYLSVPGFRLCLGDNQLEGESHSTLCLPVAKPVECPLDSWQKLQDKAIFNGDDCLENVREARQVRVGPPAYLSVAKFQQCLGKHQKPGDSHIALCLPRTKSDECPLESWNKLHDKAIFTGDQCVEGVNEAQLIGLGAPAYLAIQNFEQCLGKHQRLRDSHTTLCLPRVKPEDCPDDSWLKLQDEATFGGDKCQLEGRPPKFGEPPFLSVPEFELCLGQHSSEKVPRHSNWCLPSSKAPQCPDESWEELTLIFTGPKCAFLPSVGGPEVPKYLSVPHFELCMTSQSNADQTYSSRCLPESKLEDCPEESWDALVDIFNGATCQPVIDSCLELHTPSDSFSEPCLPQIRPAKCPQTHWDNLVKAFKGIRCRAEAPVVSHWDIGALPPAYLQVPDHGKCLHDQLSDSKTHREKCIPAERPELCSDESWDLLNTLLGVSKCRETLEAIQGQENCLLTYQPTSGHSESCLPQIQPATCSNQTWRKLVTLFTGIRCPLGAKQPRKRSEDGNEDEEDNVCFGFHKVDNDFTVRCLPKIQPTSCEDSDWARAQETFVGIGCSNGPSVSGLPPAYLSVYGHEFCLGTYRASDSHNEKCLPVEKFEDCSPETWKALNQVFDGIRCPSHRIPSSAPSSTTYQSQSVEENCLAEQIASATQMEKCLPDVKPDLCTQEMWDHLFDTFPGSSCRQDVHALPPPYLSVQGHENCLATQPASASHAERCLPKEKPQDCPVQAWESLQSNFEGNACRQSRASPIETLDFSSIQGHQACLKKYEASENHEDVCLPLSKPNDCTQGAYEALQSFAFKGHLSPQPGRTGKELIIAGLDQCMGIQPNVDGHAEKCIPDVRPDGCTEEAFLTLLESFNGVQCRQGRDDHVKFPKRPSGIKVNVQHRPGAVEIPLQFCNTNLDCFNSEEERLCNILFVSTSDAAGVTWDGICVPANCNTAGICPPVGHVMTGIIHGHCKVTYGECEYDQEINGPSATIA